MGSTSARIAVDAMGGDYAPDTIVAGALKAVNELPAKILLVGDPQQVEAALERHGSSSALDIVPASDIIGMHEEALSAVKRKPQSSIGVATELVKRGEADALVSAGHSGATMAASLLRLGRLPGIERPAIGGIFPTMVPGKQVLVLDVGANVDTRPRYLEQFATLGAIYSQYVLGIGNPKVGLLNIGEEAKKGNDLTIRTYELLENNPQIPFVGNAEGRDVLSGDFDVVVCDGFVGNVLLKFAEAVGNTVLQIFQQELSQVDSRVDMELLKPTLSRIRQRIDYVEHGGGLLLGVNGVCVISHGSSQAASIQSAIRLANEAVEREILKKLHDRYRGDNELTEDAV
jgi:glycerol-3-phosphate acyltransferase PlsX